MTKTVGLKIKESIVSRIQTGAEKSSACFFVGFNKVNSSALTDLRNQLRLSESRVLVAKNSLIQKAFAKEQAEVFSQYLQNETGIIFVYNQDIVSPCKVIVDFSKGNENFLIKGGLINGKEITKPDLESLAELPSRDCLLAQAVSGLAAPITGLVVCLNQVILKFIWLAKELQKVKESQGTKADLAEENQEKDKKEEVQAEPAPEKEEKESQTKAESQDAASDNKQEENRENKANQEQKSPASDSSDSNLNKEESKEGGDV